MCKFSEGSSIGRDEENGSQRPAAWQNSTLKKRYLSLKDRAKYSTSETSFDAMLIINAMDQNQFASSSKHIHTLESAC